MEQIKEESLSNYVKQPVTDEVLAMTEWKWKDSAEYVARDILRCIYEIRRMRSQRIINFDSMEEARKELFADQPLVIIEKPINAGSSSETKTSAGSDDSALPLLFEITEKPTACSKSRKQQPVNEVKIL